MVCPNCRANNKDHVIDVVKFAHEIRRKRKCDVCGFTYITTEKFDSEDGSFPDRRRMYRLRKMMNKENGLENFYNGLFRKE